MKLSQLSSLFCGLCSVAFAHAADLPNGDELAAYVGKYPFDEVNGYSFFENPKVIAVVDRAAGPGAADWLDGLDVGTLIARQEDGLIATVCEAHNCANNNGALALSLDGQLIALCLYSKEGDFGTMPGQVHWIGLNLDRYIDPPEGGGGCPRDSDEFLEAYVRAIR
jgi:hypothetical protein